MSIRKSIGICIIISGVVAIVSQIVFVRELLVVFYGNEISVAFILACWLIGGAIGSAGLGRIADLIKQKVIAFGSCQVLLGMLLPLTLAAIRSIKFALGINPGEVIPVFPMAASSLLVLLPVCALLGFMFALACRIYSGEDLGAAGIGTVYVLESIGSMAAGVIASFFIIRYLEPLQIISILSLILTVAATALFSLSPKKGIRIALMVLAAFIILAQVFSLSSGLWSRFGDLLLKRQWSGYTLLASRNSIYGNITVTRSSSQYSFFDNGLHLYTVPDIMASEEAVHYAMLEHPDPNRVLCIGGGVGGLLNEILKHPVRKVDYIELDPLIAEMAKEFLPGKLYAPMDDPRVSFIPEDGRLYVKSTADKYDVIIMSIGEPYTAQLNRFYTVEFFAEVKEILRDGALISFGIGSSESYMSKEQREFLRTIYSTLKSVFADVMIMPGETAFFIAGDGRAGLTYDYRILMDRAAERGVELKYVREYYLFSKLSPEMIAYIKGSIVSPEADGQPSAGGRGPRVNTDFRPISYYYDMVFWSARFKDSLFNKLLKSIDEKAVWIIVASLCAVVLMTGLFRIKKKALLAPSILSIFANGFTQISLQVIILLAFQIIYGYMFYKLGFIITSYMAGLALGGWLGVRLIRKGVSGRSELIAAQGALCVYSAVLPMLFAGLSALTGAAASWFGANIIFILLSLSCALLGGFIFPMVNRIYLGCDKAVGRAGGFIYGTDLLGACLGAILTGVFLVPILGIPKTCAAVAGLNLTVILVLFMSRRPSCT